jgi:uncharacterized membrane protein
MLLFILYWDRNFDYYINDREIKGTRENVQSRDTGQYFEHKTQDKDKIIAKISQITKEMINTNAPIKITRNTREYLCL